jgi:hypothetical protein
MARQKEEKKEEKQHHRRHHNDDEDETGKGLYEESEEILAKYFIPIDIVKTYAKKKVIYHHLRSRMLSHILFMIFFWIYILSNYFFINFFYSFLLPYY